MTYYLKSVVERDEAIGKMSDHLYSNWWKKMKKTKRLLSMEQVFLPFWCFDYRVVSHALPDGLEGRIAIEPLSEMSAILPVDYEREESCEQFIPVKKTLEDEHARKVLYWELFSKEKRREKIDVTITGRTLLYVPYWIGYIKDRNQRYDVIALDGLNGKVDLPMKETVLTYLCEEEQEIG
ncbi:hypothetical protein GLV98_07140 [Halobacillus litoralis]|uniref:Uncharacterized protein n=1 Tax=Halobacillus litoralis TaxID=45668 RepID=A0A845E3I5_9BACI|nr:hypothetical protein [Halobacillus litoralis]MYL49253.1 hypothetical protein [Halobacillus litoralis]